MVRADLHIPGPLVIGTSALLGPKSRTDALRLLEEALEAGITHVDTARAYGSGDAESVVGQFARLHPGDVTITTKFGIVPMAAVARRPAVRLIARRAMRVSPRIRRLLGRTSARLSHHGRFDMASARASIETSLRSLGVERIDVLLLHDATAADCSDQLLELLTKLRSEGTIGAFGVGTHIAAAQDIVRDMPEFSDVLQFPHNVVTRASNTIQAPAGATVVTHGALAPLGDLMAALAASNDLRRRWRTSLDLDVMNLDVLSGLLLCCAVADNPHGPVLFSTTRPERVRQNADALKGDLSDRARLDALRLLVDEFALPG